ncbi:hypothetical protein [Parvicella tangerina]|uniref:Lipoprotein n=1 Tax=Parvicella tangerina TaxID=2829795 RepID=A0A916JQK8_9FLAO|nr:hypothetical protein [Parvicella tangerina]CAG5086590.1 hypothetical protein CRYO30217_03191 [Parvicella tangerina]
MKNKLLLLLSTTTLLLACENKPNEEVEHSEDVADTNTQENSSKIEDDIVLFNNSVVAHTDMAEVQIAQLMELDEQDVNAEEMIAAAEKVKLDIQDRVNDLTHLKAVGNGSEDFLKAAIDHLSTVERLTDIYIDFADNLSVPDSLWNEEMGKLWLNLAEPVFLEYEDSYELLEIAQGNFSSLNDKDLVPSFDKTLEELQEETQ